MSAHDSAALSARREFWLLLTLAGIQFTHILDFMIMMPLGPQFRAVFGISDAQFGLLVSSYTLAAGCSGLFAALYIDRFGRKRLLLTLYGLFALATLACGLAASYEQLMAARIAAGLFGGVLSALAQTIVGDTVPMERRGRAMGLVMSSFSLSTVAGVPLGLVLAAYFSWHMPFFAIAAVSALFLLFGFKTLPPLKAHLASVGSMSPLGNLLDAALNPDHLRALAFTFALMFVGFVVIPYITMYTVSNGGLSAQQIPLMYLVGGVASLMSARWIGRKSDQVGKIKTFRVLALLTMVPVMAMTVCAPLGFAGIVAVGTLLFVLMSGRMIPGMAIVTAACRPSQRGTFMALNSAVQSMGMSAAAFVGGLIVGRDSHGWVTHYWANGLLGVCASVLTVWMVGRLRLDWRDVKEPVVGAAQDARS